MQAPHSPSFMDSPSPPNPYHKPTLSPFYYGLVVIGSTAIVLAVYNIIVVGCCKHQNRYRQNRRSTDQSTEETSRSFDNPNFQLISTFKYRKEEIREYDNECAVCLSVFEDGEDVRKLPRCNHSFHTPCIDMWLYSHSDCPLCRATVEPPPPPLPHRILIQEEENSRESGSLV